MQDFGCNQIGVLGSGFWVQRFKPNETENNSYQDLKVSSSIKLEAAARVSADLKPLNPVHILVFLYNFRVGVTSHRPAACQGRNIFSISAV